MFALVGIDQIQELGFFLKLIDDFILFYNVYIFVQKFYELVGGDVVLEDGDDGVSGEITYDHGWKNIADLTKMT